MMWNQSLDIPKFDAYILYESTTAGNLAKDLKARLKKHEINCFVAGAEGDIPVGVEEEQYRYSVLKEVEEVFLLLTLGAVERDKEIGKEINKAQEYGKPIRLFCSPRVDTNNPKVQNFLNKYKLKSLEFQPFRDIDDLVEHILYLRNEGIYFTRYDIYYWLKKDSIVETNFAIKYKDYIDKNLREKILAGDLKGFGREMHSDYMRKVEELGERDPRYKIRLQLLLSDYRHIRDEYKDSEKAFNAAKRTAMENDIRIEDHLVDIQISYGHILLHLNDLEGAKSIFQQSIDNRENHPILRARDLFRIGEIFVFQGEYDEAIQRFNESIMICNEYLDTDMSQSAYHILADDYRKMGTAYRLKNEYKLAEEYYNRAKNIYNRFGFRGRVWLTHGFAELYRAKNALPLAMSEYEKARIESHEVCNINRVAHAYLGICEVKRMQGDIDVEEYKEPLEIYKKIDSQWGIANVYISKALVYIERGRRTEADELLNDAERICKEPKLKFNEEAKLIQRVRGGSIDELHPLSLF